MSEKKHYELGDIIRNIFVIALIIEPFAFIGYAIYNYNNTAYPFKKNVGTYYDLALDHTNDIESCKMYLEKGLEGLDPYSGNYAWWYPDPSTDVDLIKNQTLNTILFMDSLKDQSNYTFAETEYIYNRISNEVSALHYAIDNVSSNLLFHKGCFIFMMITIVIVFLFIIGLCLVN
jgi:hypothetical protein